MKLTLEEMAFEYSKILFQKEVNRVYGYQEKKLKEITENSMIMAYYLKESLEKRRLSNPQGEII